LGTTACGASMGPMMTPPAQAGVLIIPVESIAEMEPPFAVRLVGRHHSLPVWLHVDQHWDFQVVAGRCGAEPSCRVGYHDDDDEFECTCTGARYRADGRSVNGRRPRPLGTHSVLYRDEIVLVDLDGRL
jgi:hypothetical protein